MIKKTASKKKKTVKTKPVKYSRNALPDLPDSRDWLYRPTLHPITHPELKRPNELTILDQGTQGACTGYGLAAVINILMSNRKPENHNVSAPMLYTLAKLHDEWPGEKYEGSSIKGAIRGWENMGVCLESTWKKYKPDEGHIPLKCAVDARSQTIGAYYRLKPKIEHFHAALCETGTLLVSAKTHRGWDHASNGIIKYTGNEKEDGGHAFAIVGYNKDGFWIQNSWGPSWGKSGLALWSYEDWNDNVMDAWVVQLAYPTPEIFGREPRSAFLRSGSTEDRAERSPKRLEIAGHFVHIDDGKFHEKGTYWSNVRDTRDTAEYVAKRMEPNEKEKRFKHLIIYAHGGLNSPKASANRIYALKEGFKRNGIYPYHIMYDAGLGEEIKDIIMAKFNPFEVRTGAGLLDKLSTWGTEMYDRMKNLPDKIIEGLVQKPVTPIWNEMKNDARRAFENKGAGTQALKIFMKAFAQNHNIDPPRVHLVGHSTGAIVLGELLEMTRRLDVKLKISSLNLFAPACTLDFFKENYVPSMKAKPAKGATISQTNIYCLTDKQELDDNVAKAYQKSLLYLVSNALERTHEKPLLGMNKFHRQLPGSLRKTTFIYSNTSSERARSQSTSHGGFDNDANTMNDVLKTILGKAPQKPFTKDELKY